MPAWWKYSLSTGNNITEPHAMSHFSRVAYVLPAPTNGVASRRRRRGIHIDAARTVGACAAVKQGTATHVA